MRRFGIVIAAGLLAAACGNGSRASSGHRDADVLSVIRAAATTTAHQQSARIRGHMTMDLGAMTGASTGAVSASLAGTLQTKPLLGQMTMSGMSVGGRAVGEVTMLMTPDAFYMKMPMLSAQLGKPWVEMKFSDMKSMSGFDFSQLMSQAQQMQPAQYLAQLVSSGDVHVVGTESVNGVDTTHYAGTVSTAKSLAHYSAAMRAQLEPLMQKAGITGTALDVWLDDKGLVRRVRSSAEGGKGVITFDMDVLAYGVPVDVTPPPASQVIDIGQLSNSGSLN